MENDTSLTTYRVMINEMILKIFIDYFIQNKYKFLKYEKPYYIYYKRIDPYDSLSDDEDFDADTSLFSISSVNSIKNFMQHFKGKLSK